VTRAWACGREPRRQRQSLATCVGLGVGALLAACTIPVATDLDEAAANKVVAALGRNGVAADKQRDTDHEGHFSVDVGRGDASFALAVMAREELPPRTAPGWAEVLGQGGFIPSRADERAKQLMATAGELQRSLLGIDDVISARVHLAVPERDALAADGPPPPPTASVLLKHGNATSPLSTLDIQRLVAGAVPGLVPASVVVVTKAVAEPVERKGTELVRLGPLTTTRSSLPYLRWMIACVATLNACMVALLFALWLRGRRSARARAELVEAEVQRQS
jgi:type III secretion system YscJ/HrcJ family lipoprotein